MFVIIAILSITASASPDAVVGKISSSPSWDINHQKGLNIGGASGVHLSGSLQERIAELKASNQSKPLPASNVSKPSSSPKAAHTKKISLIETTASKRTIDERDDEPDKATTDATQSPSLPTISSASEEVSGPAPPSDSPSVESTSAAVTGGSPEPSMSTAAGMEAQLMSLLLVKTAFGATPMGGSV